MLPYCPALLCFFSQCYSLLLLYCRQINDDLFLVFGSYSIYLSIYFFVPDAVVSLIVLCWDFFCTEERKDA